MMADLQEKLVTGGNALEEKQKEQAVKYRKFQKKLKAQKQREEQLLKEKQHNEEQVLLVKQTYKDLQTEVVAQREIIETLRSKYTNHDREVKDLNKEHFEEKQDLLNEIKSQRDELKFCKKVIALMLRPDEIARIRSKSTYSEEVDDWNVPAFIFK